MKQLFFFLKGFVVGLCDLIPGISGGTMAFILGIYERLIQLIRNIDLNIFCVWRKRRFKRAIKKLDFIFSIPFGIGLLLAIFTMASIMTYTVTTYPYLTYGFLLGVIAGSLYLLSTHFGKWTIKRVSYLIVGAIFGGLIAGFSEFVIASTPIILIIAGFVAAAAMLLPGVSGSYVLVIFGQYEYILKAIADKNILPIIFVLIGVLIGLYVMSHTIAYLLQKKHQITLFFLFGLVLGSLRLFFAKVSPGYGPEVLIAVVVGLLIPLGILFLQKVVKVKID